MSLSELRCLAFCVPWRRGAESSANVNVNCHCAEDGRNLTTNRSSPLSSAHCSLGSGLRFTATFTLVGHLIVDCSDHNLHIFAIGLCRPLSESQFSTQRLRQAAPILIHLIWCTQVLVASFDDGYGVFKLRLPPAGPGRLFRIQGA
jgi:hypothetical protein